MSLLESPIPPEPIATLRNPRTYLEDVWQAYFADVPRVNQVDIAYCQPWKRRLGLIRLSLDNVTSFIGVNALLQLAEAPEYILTTTIAHELTHYAHGFGSLLPRLYKHPHANNVVKQELERRGGCRTMHPCDEWIDTQWVSFYCLDRVARLLAPPPFYHPRPHPR